jgi:hypothetical protein
LKGSLKASDKKSLKEAAVPVWHCELKPFAGEGGPTLNALTVGSKFLLSCNGDIAVQWNGKPELVLPEKTPAYSLVILQAPKLDSHEAELLVTSYRPGEMKPAFIRVQTDSGGFETLGVEWKVQSVIPQSQQPPQPFPSYGPFLLPLPSWIWVLLACTLILVIGAVIFWFRKLQRRRRLKKDLLRYGDTPGSAIAQFQKELRALGRKAAQASDTTAIGEWNAELDQALRIYLLRELKFLTLNEPREGMLQSFKKSQRAFFDELSPNLKKIFSEMDRFQSNSSMHKSVDFEQILAMARLWSDALEKRKANSR